MKEAQDRAGLLEKAASRRRCWIVVDEERCKGCGLCIRACPRGVIAQGSRFNSRGYFPAVVDKEGAGRCTGCSLCAWMCPDVAISVFRLGGQDEGEDS